MRGFQPLLDSLRCSYSASLSKWEETAKAEICLTKQQPVGGEMGRRGGTKGEAERGDPGQPPYLLLPRVR